MKRIALLFLVGVSLFSTAVAATRPHYGGTLRIMLQSSGNDLGYAEGHSSAEYWDSARILSLIADNLVTLTPEGLPEPVLATSWRTDASGRNCQLTLRTGVRFHDGSALSAGSVAQILGTLHPDWRVQASADVLTIEPAKPSPGILSELALPQNAILKKAANGALIGTGPFRMLEWVPGHTLKLAATEDYWSGRPYLDSIEIEFAKPVREQAIALELGKTDLVELSAENAAGISQHSHTSLPLELLALVFPENSRLQDPRIKEALALSIDRKPMQAVLLKGSGELTASILPNWMTGYSRVFSPQRDLQRARSMVGDTRPVLFTLSYDPRDPQAQLMSERIALNAREAGVSLQVSLSRQADVNLVRVVLPSADPGESLRVMAREFGLPEPAIRGSSVQYLFEAERSLLDTHSVIPLFHLPLTSAISGRVRGWESDRVGGWKLADAWLEAP